MKPQHTPAPWRIAERSDALAITDSKGNRLACLSYGRGSVSMKIPSEQNNANAIVMAATPVMFAALKDIANSQGGAQGPLSVDALIRIARAALAQAGL